MILDFDVLMPENDVAKFTGKRDKTRYEVELFIPSGVALLIVENLDLVKQFFPDADRKKKSRFSKDTVDFMLKIFSIICKQQYEHMTSEWIDKNISLPRLTAIGIALVKPVLGYLSSSGLMEVVEGKIQIGEQSSAE